MFLFRCLLGLFLCLLILLAGAQGAIGALLYTKVPCVNSCCSNNLVSQLFHRRFLTYLCSGPWSRTRCRRSITSTTVQQHSTGITCSKGSAYRCKLNMLLHISTGAFLSVSHLWMLDISFDQVLIAILLSWSAVVSPALLTGPCLYITDTSRTPRSVSASSWSPKSTSGDRDRSGDSQSSLIGLTEGP